MLDFKGREPGLTLDDAAMSRTVDAAVQGSDALQLSMGQMGSLPQNVDTWCKSLGMKPTDRGMGGDRWHIGIPFSDPLLALSFMLKAERQFEAALESGRLSLHLMSWGRTKPGPANDQSPA